LREIAKATAGLRLRPLFRHSLPSSRFIPAAAPDAAPSQDAERGRVGEPRVAPCIAAYRWRAVGESVSRYDVMGATDAPSMP